MYTCFHVLSWRRIFFFRSSMSCCRWSSSLCVPATVVRAWEVYCLMAWRRRITETGDGWGSSAKLLVMWSEKLWYPSKQWSIITFTYHFPSFKRLFFGPFSETASNSQAMDIWPSMASKPWRWLLALRPKTCVWASLSWHFASPAVPMVKWLFDLFGHQKWMVE